MKNSWFFVALTAVLFAACSQSDQPINDVDNFESELLHLSDVSAAFFTQTRSMNELDGESMNVFLDGALKPFSKFEIDKQVATTSYYSHLDGYSDPEFANPMDFILTNSTAEFQKLVLSIIYENVNFTIRDIVQNDNLLPNEKIALTIVLNMKSHLSFGSNIFTRTDSDDEKKRKCYDAYDAAIANCNNWQFVGTVATVVSAFISPYLSGAFTIATVIDTQNCQTAASANLRKCLGV